MNENIIKSSVVGLTSIILTLLAISIPASIGIIFPYGRFTVGEGIEILRVGVPWLLFFVLMFLIKQICLPER